MSEPGYGSVGARRTLAGVLSWPLRFLLRALAAFLWVAIGLLTELLVFPGVRRSVRLRIIRSWSRGLLLLCGVRVRVFGEPLLQGPVLWASNHVSWVDIFVLNGVRTTAFVAKREIRRWPVIGLLVAWAGTLFIDRGQKQAVLEASRHMQARFALGDAVGLFPEGTTTDGRDVRPFHAGLFDAARHGAVSVQPVALRFLAEGRPAPWLAFVGDQTLVANLWWLLGARKVQVECHFLAPIAAAAHTRSEVAQVARERIRAVVRRDTAKT